MRPRSLRARLAVWYFATVAIICALAASGYWLAIRSELERALDQGLRYRLIGLREFLQEASPLGREEIAARLAPISELGELHQVFDADGRLIAESRGLTRHHVPQRPPQGLGFEIRFVSGGTREFPLRLAWQRVRLGSQTVILGVADPQRKFEGVLRAFTSVLLLSTPVVLALATACGVWLGRRALAPVARITEDARAITEQNLSARLLVPDSRDELQQLSETLNAMLERIEQSFARTRRFTADASHELRAPMTLIHTAAEHALRRERGREELVDAMQKILREAQHTRALIDDLLLLARGDAGREAAVLAELDAAPLVREAAQQAAALAAERGIDVSLELAPGALTVLANEAQLRRLLLILVDNALKYTQPGGRVTLSGGTDAGRVVLSVADSGVGIPPGDLTRVFERFWRADKVRSREAGGTGLGLAIAKQIADQHGAELEASSEPGRGSVFSLRLPNPRR